jgi:Ca2+-binding RTX toxin-like protein
MALGFVDVFNRLTIDTEFPPEDAAEIARVLQYAYTNSPIAARMFNNWISDPSHKIVINYSPGLFQGIYDILDNGTHVGRGILNIDLSFLKNAMYIDNNGTAQQDTTISAIVHELVHALVGTDDQYTLGLGGSYKGPTVEEANKIYRELKIPEQNSYIAQNPKAEEPSILTLGYEYTHGVAIDRSMVWDVDYFDSSVVGNSKDLLIGGLKANVFHAGEGNDFLYGNEGNDILDGGKGNDELYGGDDNDLLYGGYGNDTIYGGSGNDEIYGDEHDDILSGDDGNDTLTGGGGQDTLLGGLGDDSYNFTSGDGWDWIEDSDRQGSLFYTVGNQIIQLTGGVFVSNNTWKQQVNGVDVWYVISDFTEKGQIFQQLVISWPNGGVKIKGWQSGNLGITLEGTQPQQLSSASLVVSAVTSDWYKFDHLIAKGDIDGMEFLAIGDYGEIQVTGSLGGNLIGNDSDNRLSAGSGDDTCSGGLGRDVLIGNKGSDQLYGGDSDDALSGGDGADYLQGDAGSDVLTGGLGADILDGGAGNDYLLGGGGNTATSFDWSLLEDTYEGYQRINFLKFSGYSSLSGDGSDILLGGAGDDYLWGGGGADQLFGGADSDQLVGDSGGDYLNGGDGDDYLFGDGSQSSNPYAYTYAQYHGDDVLDGGAGDDQLLGDGGSDQLFGGDGNDLLIGDAKGLPAEYQGDDYLDGGSGSDQLIGGGGNDTLVGGDGDDHIDGDGDDSHVSYASDGDDYLDGGAGNDTLTGSGGADQLFGGEGNDFLFGDSDSVPEENQDDDYLDGGFGDDYLRGYAGNDVLLGDGGSDQILGESGNDSLEGNGDNDKLFGGEGNDTLTGGIGLDYLDGDDGDDTYIFNVGDAMPDSGVVEAVDDSGGKDTVCLLGADIDSLTVDLVNNGDGLLLGFGAGEQIVIQPGAIEIFEIGYSELRYSELVGRYLTVPVISTDAAGNATAVGGNGIDTFTVLADNVLVSGGRGTDTICATGDGVTLEYGLGDGKDFVTTGGSGNVLSFGTGITPSDITVVSANDGALVLQIGPDTSDRISFASFSAKNPLGVKPFDSIEFSDGSVIVYEEFISRGLTLVGTDGNDTLYGLTGNDDLDAGPGDDQMIGGAGSDVYHWGVGAGQDIIDNSGNTVSDVDTLMIADGMTTDSLQFIHRNNDLVIRSLNGSDQVTVLDHFGSGTLGAIEFADGTRWDSSDIVENSLDMFVLTSQQGAVSVEETSSIGATVQLGAGLSFTDLIASQSGNDLLLQVRGTESSLRLENYYQTDPTIWSIVDANGGTTTFGSLLEATEVLQADTVASLKQDFVTWAKLNLANQLGSDGYTLAEDGSWQKKFAWFSASNTYSQTDEVTSTTTKWLDGRAPTTTQTNFHFQSWSNPSWGSGKPAFLVTEWDAEIQEKQEIGADDVIHCDTYDSSKISDFGWVGVHWKLQNSYTDHYQFQSLGAVTRWVAGEEQVVAFTTSTSTVDSIQNTYTAVLDQALTKENIEAGASSAGNTALSSTLPGFVTSNQETYSIEEIYLTDGDHVVYGNEQSMVIAGTGNNRISNAGFAYGGIGDSYLIGGHILVAGKGNQWLQDGDVMMVGDGSDMVIANTGNEIYVQHNNTDVDFITSDAKQGVALLNRLYGELGIEDWQERYQYGGQYHCVQEFNCYVDSPAQVLENYLGWDEPPIETLQDILDRGYAVYIAPLPTLITAPDLEISASSYYDFHHVATQTIYANQWEKLETYVDDGTLTPTTIKFDEGLTVGDIAFSWDYTTSPSDGQMHVALCLTWGNEQGIEVLIPNSDDAVGQGLYRFEFADGSSLSLTDMMALAPDAPDFDPDFFEFGSQSGEVVIDRYQYRGIRVLAGVNETDLTVTHDGSDLLISSQVAGTTLRVVDWYVGPAMPARPVLKFSDGTFWDATKLTQLGTVIDGSSGGQIIESVLSFATTLIAGPGDTLIGHNTGDLYQYATGSGVVHIQDSGGGIIQFGSGITQNMISLGLGVGSLLLRIGDQGDEINLDNCDPGHADIAKTVQYFMFADGTELSYQELVARGFDIYGTSGDDFLTGTNLDNRIYGGDGDDILIANGRCDYLYAGGGNDTLIANDGGDVLIGGSGHTEFHTQVGNGMVTIDDSVVKTNSTESDLLLWDGEVAAQGISISFIEGNVLLLSNADESDGIILRRYLEGTANNLSRIEFGDGSYILGETGDGVFVLTCYDSSGQANGGRWEFHQYEGGDWSWSTRDTNSQTTGGGNSLADGGYSNFTRTVLEGGQVQLVERYYFSDSTQNYVIDTTTDSDGAYQQFWSRSDGTSGTEALASDGTRNVSLRRADGSYTQTTTCPDGSSLVRNFDSTDFLLSDTWVAPDGSSGNDWYNLDGSYSFTMTLSDGVVTQGSFNADGSENTQTYDVSGLLIGDSLIAADGSQRVNAGSNTLLVGTTGSDFLHGGTGKALLAGGEGNDVLQLGGDSDIVAFNVGDGLDTVVSGQGSANILSLGGGLNTGDLVFEKIGNNLVLEIGSDDSLTFENWYDSPVNQSFTALQLSSGELGNTVAIDQYNFSQLVAAFDAARTADSTITAWQLSTELLNARLSSSGDAALGGDLAYSYATQRDFDGIGVFAAQSTLSSTLFATAQQTLGQANSVGNEVAYLR